MWNHSLDQQHGCARFQIPVALQVELFLLMETKVYELRPWTISKWELTPARLSEEKYFWCVALIDFCLHGEASATEKKGACILCGDALLPKALWLQLVPDHMTLDHIDERDSEFARVSCSLEVTHSSVSTPVRQWKKVIIVPVSPFLSDGSAKIFKSGKVQTQI